MKVSNIAQIYFLFIAVIMAGCDNNEMDMADPGNPDQPTEENTIAKYSLNFRGNATSWTDENPDDADFSLHQFPTDTEGYYSLSIQMSHLTAPSSQSQGISIGLLRT